MSTKLLGKRDVSRFLKGAYQIARLENRLQGCDGIVGVCPQISVAKANARKQRYPAGKIQDDIAARQSTVAWGSEIQYSPRRRCGLGKVIDCQFKGAKMSTGGCNRALGDRKVA